MATGAPFTRITPDPSAQARGSWGVQPSGPLLALGKPRARRGAMINTTVTGTAKGEPNLPRFMPSSGVLDYAHKLTTTTLLLAGLVGVLLFGPRKPRTLLRRLGSKHIVPVKGR